METCGHLLGLLTLVDSGRHLWTLSIFVDTFSSGISLPHSALSCFSALDENHSSLSFTLLESY